MSVTLAKNCTFIKRPEELSSLLSEDSVVNKEIQFLSVLTDIDFDSQTKCHLYFKNFQDGDGEEPEYTCRIICNTTATLNLTRMTLSLFSQHFDLEFPETEDEKTHFSLENIHLDKLCFVLCKGALVGRGGSYGIFLQGLRPIDLNATLFAAGKNDLGEAVHESAKTIFDNLVNLNRNSKAQFKFVKLSNLTNEMLQYFQLRDETIQSMKAKNPIFGAARFNIDHDSVNDFDSQIADTDFDSNPIAYLSQPNNAIFTNVTQGDSLTNDKIENSTSSQLDSTISSSIVTADGGMNPRSQRLTSSPEVGQSRALEAGRGNVQVVDSAHTVTRTQYQKQAPAWESGGSASSQSQSYDGLEVQHSLKRQRVSGSLDQNIKSMVSAITAASTDDVLKLCVKVAGMRVNQGVPGPSVVLFCQPGNQELTVGSELLCVSVNCLEIEANSVDNIKCGSQILEAASSEALLEGLRLYCKEDKLTVTVRKVPVLLGNGHFTFTLALRSVQCDERDRKGVTSTPPTLVASQGVVSSNQSFESSQGLRDPLKTFSAISVAPNQVEFVRTFALLVSAKTFGSKITKFAFTDFTSHPNNTLSAADAFLGTYTDRLPQNKVFPFVIYNDHLAEFDRYVREKMGLAYRDLFNVYDTNLTHQGIVCRLELKVKLYNGGVDGIVRTCEPILAHDASLRPDEKQFLRSFYARGIAHIPQSLLVNKFDNYAVFFSITKFNGLVVVDDRQQAGAVVNVSEDVESSLQAPVWEPPNLSVVTTNLQVTKDLELPVLATMRGDDSGSDGSVTAIFQVQAKVVHVFQGPESLVLYLTNEYYTQDMLDPHRLLRVEIPGARNIASFYGGARSRLSETELLRLLAEDGERLTFRLSPFSVPVSSSRNLRIWCPIEFSIYEIEAELDALRANVRVKQEKSITDH
ncbi:LAFA_0F15016g1_1 [Lachancea sp. 'fantastica']|nr:LAFA_0F15016g1_1 [Lachancea sp. 'fantastica']